MLAAEGLPVGEQLVREDSESEDVGAPVDRLSANLLGREVGRGAEGDSRLGQVGLGLKRLGDAEIHDLDGAVVEDAHVGGFHVAVDDRGVVRIAQSVGDGHQDLDLPGHRHRVAPLDLLVEVLAGQKLLDDVRDPVLDAEVVDRGDVPVVQVSGELGFAEETVLDLLVVDLAGLDRNGPLDERIPSPVDRAESADADLLRNFVFADFLEHPSADPR
jgi:hypothetical protein